MEKPIKKTNEQRQAGLTDAAILRAEALDRGDRPAAAIAELVLIKGARDA